MVTENPRSGSTSRSKPAGSRRAVTPLLLFLALCALCALCVFAVPFPLWRPRLAWARENDVTTGASAGYPELAPQTLSASPEEVFRELAQAAAALPRWRVVRQDGEELWMEAEVTTALFGFVDDLTARVEPHQGGARVMIRSRSRVGRGDLGENARHIRALQQALERRLRQ